MDCGAKNRQRGSARFIRLGLLVLAGLLFSGCSSGPAKPADWQIERLFPSIVQATMTPFQPLQATVPPPTATPTSTPVPDQRLSAWLDPALPDPLLAAVILPAEVERSGAPETAGLQIGALRGEPQVTWVYVLAAAFPTVSDEISLDEVQRAWRGESGAAFSGPLLLSESTKAAFAARWGPAGEGRLRVLPAADLLDAAWEDRSARALIPFEALRPEWKALRVDGVSPLEKELDLRAYPLTVWFGVAGQPGALFRLKELRGEQPVFAVATNRDESKMTTLVMTGVTALARATGHRMETQGNTYPARDIQAWLRNADLTHISNEVSFTHDCPPANPFAESMMFCSRPEYIELLDFIGTDIVELSGNHNKDWGWRPFSYSLDLYEQRGWTIFAGGADLQAARTPAKIEHNGNRLAFIGCNPVGPEGVFATDSSPGVARCGDYQWLHEQVRALRDEGYLPIVTFQYFELYINYPSEHQERNFRAAADAGAVIVSGSQAHFPQYMEFYEGAFIHYGLGNLFFDQMDIPVPGTREEFIDRHVFYDGRHIQTELLTALLEDYARPRPMTQAEREAFLSKIFQAKGW